MGLRLTLPRECNNLYCEFINAYWSLSDIGYDTNSCFFVLTAYPSREHKFLNYTNLPATTMPMGGVASNMIQTELYRWKGTFSIASIFPNGIPLSEDQQKTVLYKFIKSYTGLPFTDVFETDNLPEEVVE